jgi:hypothetical protein
MKSILLIGTLVLTNLMARGQELYPYAEPASNMPANSIAIRNMSVFHGDIHSDKTVQRHLPELMFGLSKKWMVHVGTGFSNMHQQSTVWEGARLYAKYRFFSADDVHKHFRMAVFGGGAYSRNHLDHNELNLQMGEQSGIYAGLIATQLWNRFAVSATGSWNEVLNKERWEKALAGLYAVRSLNYSLSAGYLLLPFEYKNYDQTNINLYAELIGGKNIGFSKENYFVDLFPSVQAIFKSTTKLSAGYRFQLGSDIYRLTKKSWMLSVEYIFLNAPKKKTK